MKSYKYYSSCNVSERQVPPPNDGFLVFAGDDVPDGVDDGVQFGFVDEIGPDDEGNGPHRRGLDDGPEAFLLAEHNQMGMGLRDDGDAAVIVDDLNQDADPAAFEITVIGEIAFLEIRRIELPQAVADNPEGLAEQGLRRDVLLRVGGITGRHIGQEALVVERNIQEAGLPDRSCDDAHIHLGLPELVQDGTGQHLFHLQGNGRIPFPEVFEKAGHQDRRDRRNEGNPEWAGESTLSKAEISSIARESFAGVRSVSFANRMLVTYVALTFVSFLCLKLTGLPWFDAATHAMSACSTCGFSTRNTSVAFFDNPAAELVMTLTMLAAGIHFGILFLALLRGKPEYFWKSETIKVFLSLVGVAIIIVTADLLINGHYASFSSALRDASFQVASISTTTGFATQDTTLWPPLSMSILIICSLICGCSGSTSGGIKIDRAIVAIKGLQRKVKLTVSPNAVTSVRVDGKAKSIEQVSDAFGYIFCYLLIVVAFATLNNAMGLDFTTGVTASVACIGNVGPGFGEVGSMCNYAAFPPLLKVTSMLEMMIGRLEIFPVLYLVRSIRRK